MSLCKLMHLSRSVYFSRATRGTSNPCAEVQGAPMQAVMAPINPPWYKVEVTANCMAMNPHQRGQDRSQWTSGTTSTNLRPAWFGDMRGNLAAQDSKFFVAVIINAFAASRLTVRCCAQVA